MADKLRITLGEIYNRCCSEKQKNSRSFRFKKIKQNSGNA